MATKGWLPTLIAPQELQALLSPLTQACPKDQLYIQGLMSQAMTLVHMGQEILSGSSIIEGLAHDVKNDISQLAGQVREGSEEEKQSIVFHLYKHIPSFSYYIQAIPEIKRIIFKRRQLRMTFRVFDSNNTQSVLPGKIYYTIKAFTCAPPYREISVTSTGTPIIVGETTVETENQSNFEFFNICFTAGSSKYPHGYFNLVVMSVNCDQIEPLVVERVNVRLKYRKVMIMKNRRKKLCMQQKAQIYGLETN